MDNSNTDKIVEQLNKVMSNKTMFGKIQYSNEDDFLLTIQNLTEEDKKEIIKSEETLIPGGRLLASLKKERKDLIIKTKDTKDNKNKDRADKLLKLKELLRELKEE